MSAATTPASVTFGKSSPFAIICVPTSTFASPERNRSSSFSCASFSRVVSTSTRTTRAPANRFMTSSATFCVPAPKYLM